MEPRDPAPLLDRLTAWAATDERILAVLVYGSHATGTADAYSDVDIGVVLADAHHDAVIANRDALIGALGEPLFAEDFDTPSNIHVINADGAAYELIFSRPAELDLGRPFRVLFDRAGVVEAAAARSPTPDPDVVEHLRQLVTWFWHDLEHVITAVARGQLLWAHGGLEEVRGVCIGLARMASGADPEPDDPYWKVDTALPPDLVARLRATVVPVERTPVLRAAHELLALFRELAHPLADSHRIAYPAELDRMMAVRLDELGEPG